MGARRVIPSGSASDTRHIHVHCHNSCDYSIHLSRGTTLLKAYNKNFNKLVFIIYVSFSHAKLVTMSKDVSTNHYMPSVSIWAKAKVLRNQSLHGKKAASGCFKTVHQWKWNMPTTAPPLTYERNSIFKWKQHTNVYIFMTPTDQKNRTTKYSM